MKKFISMLLVLVTVFTTVMVMFIPAHAATTSTYIVTTKANYWYPGSESITIKQVKEEYYSNPKKTKTKKRNMSYTVTCTPISWSGKKPKTIKKEFSGSSKKIDLEKNTTYRVTIVPWNYYGSYGVKKAGYAYISDTHKATFY